jgi:hypothetical protein
VPNDSRFIEIVFYQQLSLRLFTMESIRFPKIKPNNDDIELESAIDTSRSTIQRNQTTRILRVIDAPLDGQAPKLLLQVHEQDNFQEKLGSLPEHTPKSARIYEYSPHYCTALYDMPNYELRLAIVEHIRSVSESDLAVGDLEALFDAQWYQPPTNDVRCITQQWTQDTASTLGTNWLSTRNYLTYRLEKTPKTAPIPSDSQLAVSIHGNDKLISKMNTHHLIFCPV